MYYGVNNSGTFTMNGGSITGGWSCYGVDNYSYGTFTMNGGSITVGMKMTGAVPCPPPTAPGLWM